MVPPRYVGGRLGDIPVFLIDYRFGGIVDLERRFGQSICVDGEVLL